MVRGYDDRGCGGPPPGRRRLADAGRVQLSVRRAGVVMPVPADPRGVDGPTPGQARGPRWRTTSPGRFVPADVAVDHIPQRIVEAVAGAAGGAAATGWAALQWQGARWFGGRTARGAPLPVPLAVGDSGHLAPRPGVAVWHDWLFEDDVVVVDGLPLTRPERSVCAAAVRARGLEDAVRIVDLAAADDLVSLAGLRAYADRLRGRPGTRRLRAAIGLGDENVWSPQETTMRLRWTARRPCRLLCNQPIFDLRGRHLLTPDLLDPSTGVLGEYNGDVHDASRVARCDLDREEVCRDLGLEVVAMVSEDHRDRWSFERRVDGAYRRQQQRGAVGAWTLEQPAWWVDTTTVARRLALDDDARRRWLPWRRG